MHFSPRDVCSIHHWFSKAQHSHIKYLRLLEPPLWDRAMLTPAGLATCVAIGMN